MSGHQVEIFTILLALVLFLVSASRRLPVPYPVVLVLGGLAAGFVPGLPPVRLDPDIVFFVFLPPILWAAAYFTSLRDFRANLRPIGLLAIGLVLVTTITVAVVARALLPGMSWAAAIALGAIVSPPDAVSATAVARRLRVPQRVITVLEGESLVNDASALVLYRAAVAAMVTGTFDAAATAGQFFIAAGVGVALGVAVGALASLVLRHTGDSQTEIAVTLLAPYVAWALGERFHASAVLACVAGGFYLRRRISYVVSPSTRLQARAVWDVLIFLLNSVIFLLIGLELRSLVAGVPRSEVVDILGRGAVVSAAAIVVRLLWVPAATWIPRALSRRIRERDPLPPASAIFVVAWTGMRGVVSLAAALALPETIATGEPLPYRDEIILITFAVIFSTLVLQGLTLPPLIRMLNLPFDDSLQREESLARREVLDAGRRRLDELAEELSLAGDDLARLRQRFDGKAATADNGGSPAPMSSLTDRAVKRARFEILAAERRAAIALRDRGITSDEVLFVLERELDLEAEQHGLADLRSAPGAGAAG